MIDKNRLEEKCSTWNIALTGTQLDQLDAFAEILVEYNQKVNLTAITDPEGIEDKHFLDSLLFAAQPEVAGKMVDVGAGAGFPGIVTKIYKPELELTLTPQWSTRKTIFGEDEKAWLIGIGPLGSVRVEELGFSEALKTGLVQTWRLVDLTWKSFVKLAQRVVPADQVGGPIMIAQMVGQQAEQGLVGVLGLAALISINLAILNLLPVPVLDGGQMLFCLIEMIFRRPVPQKIQEWGMRVGMALLLSLMIFATFNDVTRIINTPDEAPAVEKTAP